MTQLGEEAAGVGSAAAIKPQDMIFPQYREAGAFLWRGFSIQQMAH
jgi:2-oxoisovalerate dehydrogenase E1 component alpha subunit